MFICLVVTGARAPGVGRRERARDAGPDARDLARRQRAAAAEGRRQVLAVDQLHDDVRAAGVLAVVVHRDDVRVAQRGGCLGLLAEARREVGVAQVLGAQELERDVTTETGISGAVDGRHPARAEQLDQSIAAAKDLSDLRQVVPSLRSRAPVRPSRLPGIVPYGASGQSWRSWR